jgi:hypothetical protein
VFSDAAPAAYVDAPAPQMILAKDPDGQLRLHIQPPPGVRVFDLKLTADTAATLTAIGGVALQMPLKPGGATFVRWSTAQSGFDLVIRPGGPGKLKAEYAATLEQWPAGVAPLPRRPADVMPFDLSDSTVFEGVRRFAW